MKKKGLLGLAMCAMLVFPIAGCNKDKIEGTYEFDALKVTEEGETKSYTCSVEDVDRPSNIDGWCASIGNGRTQLKLDDDGEGELYFVDKEGNKLENSAVMEFEYKIEDGKFKLKTEEDNDFLIYGTYEDGVINYTKGYIEALLLFIKRTNIYNKKNL